MKFTALILASLLATSAQAIGLAGDQIDASIVRTDPAGGYPLGRILDYGLDAPFTVVDGPSDALQYSSAFTLDVDATSFRVDFLSSAGWQNGIVFRLDDLDFATSEPSFLSGVTFDTNLVGFTSTLGSDFLEIHWGGTQFTSDTYLQGSFNVSPVPEPATYLLMALGLAGLVARKRFAAS